MIFIRENKRIGESLYMSIYPLFFKGKSNLIYPNLNNTYLNSIISDETHLKENIFQSIKKIFTIRNEKKFFSYREVYFII